MAKAMVIGWMKGLLVKAKELWEVTADALWTCGVILALTLFLASPAFPVLGFIYVPNFWVVILIATVIFDIAFLICAAAFIVIGALCIGTLVLLAEGPSVMEAYVIRSR